MTLLKLALVTPQIPYPPLSGGTAHMFQALRQLTQYYAVHLHALTSDRKPVNWGPLAELCTSVHAYPRAPHPLFSSPIPAIRIDASVPLLQALRSSWKQQPPDIVQLEFTSMAQYAKLARNSGAMVVCTAHITAFLAQLRRVKTTPPGAQRLRRLAGTLALWQYEIRALQHCDLVVTLSPVDAAALQRWLPSLRVEYVPSGIDLETWTPCFNPNVEDNVLFVGNYLHPPNVEGVKWLVRDVWPRVLERFPHAKLTLAGRAPPADIQALASQDIHVPGTIDDLRDVYGQASTVVAPIFWGSGVRIKLLEALACGIPVVTTPLAAEGIDIQHFQSALFADTAPVFADMIIRLLQDKPLRIRLGAGGRAVVERDYDWKRIGRNLTTIYSDVLSQRQAKLRRTK